VALGSNADGHGTLSIFGTNAKTALTLEATETKDEVTGAMSLFGHNGKTALHLGVTSSLEGGIDAFAAEGHRTVFIGGADGKGYLRTSGPNDASLVTINAAKDESVGMLTVHGRNSKEVVRVGVDDGGSGFVQTNAVAGHQTTFVGTNVKGFGYVGTYGPTGTALITLSSYEEDTFGGGLVQTFAIEGTETFRAPP
jgi:hypothetical protein